MIAVTVAIGSTTSFRATAEAEGFASACSSALVYKQENPTVPGGGSGGGGGGSGAGGEPVPTGEEGSSDVVPVTRITFGPASKTRARRPVFRFTDATGQAGTRFFCKVDRGGWRSCGSPTRLKQLSFGRHTFSVRALSAAGTLEPDPAKRRFKLVRR